MSTSDIDYAELGRRLADYCHRYSIPIEYFFQIIDDQKVVPMIRGKGMEYDAFLLLKQVLNQNEWIVEKLNLSPQPGSPDQDIGITHRRTGLRLTAESKSSVRGSMKSGMHSPKYRVPHFNVKCHRSRSNIRLAETSNDRYKADAFDVLLTNPSNAIFAGRTIGEELELIKDEGLLATLNQHYNVSTSQELIIAANHDWRFVLPPEIADERGFIPRTPAVLLEDDPNWQPLHQLESKLTAVVKERRASRSRTVRS